MRPNRSPQPVDSPHESTLIARLIETWLYLGIAGVLLLPAARAHSIAFGWTAYWLVGAPLLMWAMQHRQRLAARARTFLVGSFVRRRSDVAGAGCPFERRQGWRHVRAQARRLRPALRSVAARPRGDANAMLSR
jgi:hypothetical protein